MGRPQNPSKPSKTTAFDYYSFDGTKNNLECPKCQFGATDECLVYATQYDSFGGADIDSDKFETAYKNTRPTCTELEKAFTSDFDVVNSSGLSHFAPMFGQFSLSHDLALSPSDPDNCNDDPDFLIDQEFCRMKRLKKPSCIRNEVTAWIDLSNVYGSTDSIAARLRLNGTPYMDAPKDNLPRECATKGIPMDDSLGQPQNHLYCAGDVRANENVRLTYFHWLFVMEHNRLVDKIKDKYSYWSNDQIFQKARAINIGQYQAILKYEWLPAMMGQSAYDDLFNEKYQYKPQLNESDEDRNPGIFVEFSGAIYRVFRNLVATTMRFPRWQSDSYFDTSLGENIFNPGPMASYGGSMIAKGMMMQESAEPGIGANSELQQNRKTNFHLFSMDCLRGREAHIADYKSFTKWLAKKLNRPFLAWTSNDIRDITLDSNRTRLLRFYYEKNKTGFVNNLDLAVAALMEDPFPGAPFGKTMTYFLGFQFKRLTESDRFWFENNNNKLLTTEQKKRISETTMSDIVLRHSEFTEFPKDAFFTPNHSKTTQKATMKDYRSGEYSDVLDAANVGTEVF
eukprot:GHVL01021243.1.p1 GENE.GHVL01021243.1~~GHVL01021243.1.p1  ORF type:complete len:567 (+),score=99.24 GHVL01021243.1:514-2214(+)